jgi:hypothetical protein
MGEWAPIGAVIPHSMFWGFRSRETDLPNVDPFRPAAEAVAGKTKGPGDLTIVVSGVRVESDDEFLIFASYAKAPHAWRPSAPTTCSIRLPSRASPRRLRRPRHVLDPRPLLSEAPLPNR